jgi:hypothetical protein
VAVGNAERCDPPTRITSQHLDGNIYGSTFRLTIAAALAGVLRLVALERKRLSLGGEQARCRNGSWPTSASPCTRIPPLTRWKTWNTECFGTRSSAELARPAPVPDPLSAGREAQGAAVAGSGAGDLEAYDRPSRGGANWRAVERWTHHAAL